MQSPLDNRVFIPLPEGVSIEMVPAGIVVRSCAYMVDFIIRSLIVLLGVLGLSWVGASGVGILLVLAFVISWGYYIVLEARSGQTPGKKMFKLLVVEDSGLPVSMSSVIIRNLIRPVDAFPFGYVMGLISMACNREFKRLGDWAAGTRVVYLEGDTKLNLLAEGTIKVPPIKLNTDEQRTLMLFNDRSQTLSEARRRELAQILIPVFDLNEENAVEELHEIARYYAGQSA